MLLTVWNKWVLILQDEEYQLSQSWGFVKIKNHFWLFLKQFSTLRVKYGISASEPLRTITGNSLHDACIHNWSPTFALFQVLFSNSLICFTSLQLISACHFLKVPLSKLPGTISQMAYRLTNGRKLTFWKFKLNSSYILMIQSVVAGS